MRTNLMTVMLLWVFSVNASAAGIDGDVYYLGIAINQEGAAGGWAQVGGPAQWKQTIAGTILNGKMYTAESSGCLFVTDLQSGNWQQIGKADFADTQFMVSAGPHLYTIESTGNLYRVNPSDGTWQQVGRGGDWKQTIAAASLRGRIYSIESSGVLYGTNVENGGWTPIGKADFANTRFLFASGSSLYTIETDGTLYRVSPRNGSWAQVGPAGAWKNAIGGTILNQQLYTVESDGKLYSSDPRTGMRRGVGKADFASTRFIFPSGGKLYTIEESGNLYRVEGNTGREIDAFDWCTDEIERLWQTQGAGLSRAMHSRKIVGAKATHHAILDGFKWLAEQTKPQDLVILYLTAHGATDPNRGWNIGTADLQTLWGSEVKKALGQLPCRALALIETCECGGFAEAHQDDPPVPANVAALCACKANESTNNPLDIAVAEALYGRADFNHDGTIDLDELIKYVELRYKEFWPVPGEGTNTPVIVRGSKVNGTLSLTKASRSLSAVAVNDDFWSALDEGPEKGLIKVHVLGWSSEPGKPYYVTNTASREQMSLEIDGPPLLVEQNGAWHPARRVRVEGNKITAYLLGKQSAEVTVGFEQVRYPFVGGPR